MDSNNSIESEELSNQLEIQKIEDKYRNVIDLFKSSEVVQKVIEFNESTEPSEEVKEATNLISGLIDKIGLFNKDSDKKDFSENLSKILSEDNTKKILSNPFIKILKNMAFSLTMKSEGAK